MKGMPFDLKGNKEGVFQVVTDFSSLIPTSVNNHQWEKEQQQKKKKGSSEPTSVLDTRRSPSPPTSSSTTTLSSSLGSGSGGSTDTGGVAAVSDNPPHHNHNHNHNHNWPPSSTTQEGSSSSAPVVAADLPGGGAARKDEWGSSSSDLQPIPTAFNSGGGGGGLERCGGGLGMEDLESMLSETVVASSPSQEQSLLRWIMGDVDDPSSGLKQLLQGVGPSSDLDNNGGCGGGVFGLADPNFVFDPISASSTSSMNVASLGVGVGGSSSMALPSTGFGFSSPANNNGGGRLVVPNSMNNPSFNNNNKIPCFNNTNPSNPIFSASPNSLPLPMADVFYAQQQQQQQQQQFEQADQKPNHHQLLINHPTQNQAFFVPLPYSQQQDHQNSLLIPPHPKRHHSAMVDPSSYPAQEIIRHQQPRQQQQQQQQGFPQLLPNHLQQRSMLMSKQQKVVGASEEAAAQQQQQQQQQQALVDQLFKAAELIESGNLVHARGILARLNHQLSSPVGKPIIRAAFYFKEALQLLLHNLTNNNVNVVVTSPPKRISTPFDVFLKIDTYKAFSEMSPILQFVNFTCNQALLESLESFHCIHIIDFDIGFGGQWASFMQEIALRAGGPPSLKITAIASQSSYDHPLEVVLTQENLAHFANDLGISFKFELLSLDTFESLSLHESEAIAVNLPAGSLSYHPSSLPSLLRLVKQISPKIVVSMDRGCDRSDLPFAHHFLQGLQSYSVLLDSLDSINTNSDIVNKIERFLLQPRIESAVLRRHHVLDKLPPWRTLFASAGFAPFTFSNFCETQAECLVKRLQVRGFHVEKRQASLVLCWQRRELVSASAWSC